MNIEQDLNQKFELTNLDDYSLENIFSLYNDGYFYFYNILNTVNFPKDISPSLYNLYEISQGDVWTSISFKVYGTIKLWWLICAVNQIQNPLIVPVPGTKLKLLSLNAVSHVLKSINIS